MIYERLPYDPVTGQQFRQSELHVPMDVHHVIGRMEEYILAFNKALEVLAQNQQELANRMDAIRPEVKSAKDTVMNLHTTVTNLIEQHKKLLEGVPVPAHRCQSVKESSQLTCSTRATTSVRSVAVSDWKQEVQNQSFRIPTVATAASSYTVPAGTDIDKQVEAMKQQAQATKEVGERIQAGMSAVAYGLLAIAEAIESNGFLKMEDE